MCNAYKYCDIKECHTAYPLEREKLVLAKRLDGVFLVIDPDTLAGKKDPDVLWLGQSIDLAFDTLPETQAHRFSGIIVPNGEFADATSFDVHQFQRLTSISSELDDEYVKIVCSRIAVSGLY